MEEDLKFKKRIRKEEERREGELKESKSRIDWMSKIIYNLLLDEK